MDSGFVHDMTDTKTNDYYYVKAHGEITTTPCTSQECTWNKGKKRKKNPPRLSVPKYPSKFKKRKIQVIDFNPRPAK